MAIIGIPKPRKPQERRLALTLEAVELLARDHAILIERGAGAGIGITDEMFASLHDAVTIVPTKRLYRETDILVSVKEPIAEEREFLAAAKRGLHIFSFLHQPEPWLTELFRKISAVVIPFERIIDNGSRSILAPMSMLAAQTCLLEGINHYRNHRGPYLEEARLAVIGAEGTGGSEAIALALECGFRPERIIGLDLKEKLPPENVAIDYIPVPTTKDAIAHALTQTDIAICAVKTGDAKAPKLITREMIAGMPEGSFFADMSIDEGGASETSRPTTHANPTYEIGGVTHYCVSNVPAIRPKTATEDLAFAVYPYLHALADAYPLTPTAIETSAELGALKNAAIFFENKTGGRP